MKYLSLSQAAKVASKSKSTISQALKTGRMSYVEKTPEGFKIDPAELFRVFPQEQSEPVAETDPEPKENNLEAALLREMIGDLRSTIDDLRKRLDNSEQQRERLSLRLEHKQDDKDDETEQTPPPRKSLLERIFGSEPEY